MNHLIKFDYSALERKVLEASELDRMTLFASRLFKIPYDEVTSVQRAKAKTLAFGVAYGSSLTGRNETKLGRLP